MNNPAKEKIEAHAKIVADIIKACFKQVCPTPRELDQQELYNVIKAIGQSCFIQGYAIGSNESNELTTRMNNAVHE